MRPFLKKVLSIKGMKILKATWQTLLLLFHNSIQRDEITIKRNIKRDDKRNLYRKSGIHDDHSVRHGTHYAKTGSDRAYPVCFHTMIEQFL
ncbi:MAG: hypothetical protein GPOALKHO_000399 [Sodalis sp.]|nr:MAG: hypothetical protein GPOALKHO_000399 [Sodalis sp.]